MKGTSEPPLPSSSLKLKDIHRRFRDAGERQGWWGDRGPLVAAVSGGGDSIGLLVLLHRFWRGPVVVAHVEHGIRGAASIEDARFVQAMALKLTYPSVVVSVDVPRQRRQGESLEEAARRLRYEALEKVRQDWLASWVLLAHQADDQAETVLFHLCRGTGLRGLIGIPSLRPPFARPLMAFSGSELRVFLEREGFSWVEDGTNSDSRYSRNRIRNEVLPLMRRTLNARVDEHLAALAREAAELAARIEGQNRVLLNGLRSPFPGALRSWTWEKAKGLSPFERCEALRAEAVSLGWPSLDRGRTESLAGLVGKGGRWTFQWKKDLQTLCGQRWIAWTSGRPATFSARPISLGRGLFRGPFWTLSWENTSGIFALLVPLGDRATKETKGKIPWWLWEGWPAIVQGSTMIWCPFFDGEAELTAEPLSGLALRLRWSIEGGVE